MQSQKLVPDSNVKMIKYTTFRIETVLAVTITFIRCLDCEVSPVLQTGTIYSITPTKEVWRLFVVENDVDEVYKNIFIFILHLNVFCADYSFILSLIKELSKGSFHM